MLLLFSKAWRCTATTVEDVVTQGTGVPASVHTPFTMRPDMAARGLGLVRLSETNGILLLPRHSHVSLR